MKTILIILISIIFINSAIAKEVTGINISKCGTDLILKFFLPQYQIKDILVNGNYYKTIYIDGYGISASVGKPNLPQISFKIAINSDKKPLVKIINKKMHVETLDKHIAPYQASWPINLPIENKPFDFDYEYYNSLGDNNFEMVKVSETFIIGGIQGVTVTVFPFSYNPENKKLTIIDDAEIIFELDNNTEITKYYSESFNRYIRNIFVNYEEQNNVLKSGSANSNYLIITAPELLNSDLQNFIDYKTSKGYAVEYYTTSTIGNTNNEIKTFIQQRYNNLSTRPEFILLVGDVDKIPTWTGAGNLHPTTDLNYALLEGNDYYADACIGRFSVSTQAQLANVVNKTIYMESSMDVPLNKNIFIASQANHEITEGTHDYIIEKYFIPEEYINQKLYGYTYNATTGDVINALNNNQVFAIYFGDGNGSGWIGYPALGKDDVRSLTNTISFPLVYSFDCLNGSYQQEECFGETWIRTANGGAIFYGSSQSGYWDESAVLEKGVFKAMFEDQLKKIGTSFNAGKIYFVNHYGGNVSAGSINLQYLEMFNLLGDPSLDLGRFIKYCKSVTLDQESFSSNSFGSIGIWNIDNSQFESTSEQLPTSVPFEVNSTQYLQADTNVVSEETDQKFHNWLEGNNTYYINFKDFPITENSSFIVANFVPIKNSIIKNVLIDAPNLEFGKIWFKDPWLRDDASDPKGIKNRGTNLIWHDLNSPLPINTNSIYKGVFLNQEPSPPNPNVPFYTVRAPLKQVLGTRNFIWWSSTNAEFANSTENLTGFDTKAVIFKGANDTVKAVYKGNKMSSTTSATFSNSQRKVVYSETQGEISIPMYAGYESGGYVWLTYSSNNGSNWQPEQTPGKGSYISLTPSHMSTPLVDVVCQSETDNSKAVHYMKWGTNGSSFNNTLETGISSSVDPKPVFGRTNGTTSEGTLCAVWRGSSALRYSFTDDYYPISWYGPYNIPNTTSLHKNPSASYLPNFTYYLTYDDGIKIYLRSVRKDGSNLTWASPLVVQGSYESTSQNAQVESEPYGNYGKAHIVWEGDDGGGGKSILYQRFYQTGILSGTWSPLVEMYGANFSNPSVAVYSSANIAITWQDGLNVYKTNYNENTNTWSSVDYFSNSYGSNLITGDRRISIDNAKLIYEYGFNQPYGISFGNAKVTTPPPPPPPGCELLAISSSRRVEIGKKETKSKIGLTIHSVRILFKDGTTETIDLENLPSDLTVNNLTIDGLLAQLTTKEKSLVKDAKSLKIIYSIRARLAKELQEKSDVPINLSILLQDKNNNSVLKSIPLLTINSDSLNMKNIEVSVPVSALWINKPLSLKPQITGSKGNIGTDDSYYTNVVNSFAIDPCPPPELPKHYLAEEKQIPTEYLLGQNYPNPFNPVTQISYALPEAGYITLKVYDVLGREAALLVDEFKEAGYYEATWDATNIPSGVYFYKLTVSSFTSVKKMILMR